MTLSQFLLILRARWKVLLVVFLLVFGGTIAYTVLASKQYTATTSLVIDIRGMDPVLGLMLPGHIMPSYIATQIDIIKSHKVAADVVGGLKLAANPAAREKWRDQTGGAGTVEDWLADVLNKSLDVTPSKDSNVLEVSWTGADPGFAAVVANAFADAYIKTNLELRVEPARQASLWFDERLQGLRQKLEAAQGKLNDYQQRKGIVSSDERLDVETAKLSELSAQLVQAQALRADSLSRQKQLNETLARGANLESVAEVIQNGLIQNLKAQLVQSEGRLEQISSQLGANHPEVQRLKADVQSQRVRLRKEIDAVAEGIQATARIAVKREAELRSAVEEQKRRLMQMNSGRDELAVLLKEVETAQRAYEAAATRFTQTDLERQSTQTDIMILTRAIPPTEPSAPRVILNTILGLVIGGLLALGVAMMLEILNRRVRVPSDLNQGFEFPVLGVLEKARVRRPWPRVRWWRRQAAH